MSQSKTLLRYGGFVFSVGSARAIGIVISSITFPYVVRRLGVETYGLWSYVAAVCLFVNGVANPGLTAYATQQVAARRKEAFDLVTEILALRVVATALAILLLLGLAAIERSPDVRHLLRFYGIGVLLTGLANSDYLLGALELFHVRSLLTVAQQLLYALGLFRLVHGPKDVDWLAASILASSFLANLAGWVFLAWNGLRLHWSVRPRRWKSILVPSGHYAASNLLSNLYHRSGHLLVRWLLGEYGLGLYAAAVRFADIIQQFIGVILSVFMPRLAKAAQSPSDVARVARLAVTVIAFVSLPIMAGAIATAHLIVPWVFGAKYLGDIQLVRWISPYLVAAPAASLLAGTILYAVGRHRAYVATTACGAIAGVVAYLVLIPILGLKGAALAFVFGQAVVAAAAYALLPRDVREACKNPYIAVAAAASLGMMLVVRLVNSHTSRPLVVLSAGILAYALLSIWPVKRFLSREFGFGARALTHG
jgi:O-antigen/teichoic acid export membrane protein